VITKDPDLREEIERLCAAAGLTPDVVAHPADGRGRWAAAVCILVGDDATEALRAAELRHRPGVILVTGNASVLSWQCAVSIRAEAVIELPKDRAQLAALLADAAEATTERGQVLGVIGARGGVGATTLAAKLALVAVGLGEHPVLVDADPGSGGMDILLGCEAVAGLRWPDVLSVQGRVSSAALRAALPSSQGVAVLSWSAGDAGRLPAGGGAIIAAARRGSGLVVVDLPRHLDGIPSGLFAEVDVVLLVSGCDLRSVAAAARVVDAMRPRCSDLRLVLRAEGRNSLDVHHIGEVVGLPIEGFTRHTGRSQRSIDDGLGPLIGRRERKDLERLIGRLLAPVR